MKNRLNKKKNFFPKIFTPAKSLWYVSFYASDEKGEVVRRRYYGDINKHEGFNAKMKEAERIRSYIEKNGCAPESRQGARVLRIKQNKDNNKLNSCLNQFLKYKEPYLRKKTLQDYKSKIDIFKNWMLEQNLEKINVAQVSEPMAQEFINTLRSLANNTKNDYIELLARVYKYFIKEKIVKNNPFADIEKFKGQTMPAAAFEKKQIEKLNKMLKQRDKQLWLACMMQYYTFIRPGELRQLQLKHIFLDSQKILIPGAVSKNKNAQYVAIPAQLLTILEDFELYQYPGNYYLFGNKGEPGLKMVGVNTMSGRHRNILRELKFDSRYKFYSWKHTGGCACALASIPVKQIQLQMRHSTLEQTDQYLRSLGIIDLKNIRENFPGI